MKDLRSNLGSTLTPERHPRYFARSRTPVKTSALLRTDPDPGKTSALLRTDPDPGKALELRPRFASLADHGPQPVAGGFPVRNQFGPIPPLLVIQMQQFRADDHEPDQ